MADNDDNIDDDDNPLIRVKGIGLPNGIIQEE